MLPVPHDALPDARPRPIPAPFASASKERRVEWWIGDSIRIEGRVVSNRNVMVNGQVDGSIEAGDHTLTVAVGADVRANLFAKIIVISGDVVGNVTATERIDLRATGSVDGDMLAPTLGIADGAVATGRIEAGGKRPLSQSA